MIFSLEVVQALEGDCLLLHYGTDAHPPKIILIDGGPSPVYTNFLKPRLLKIKRALAPNDPLPLDMVMVSHIDDDHINGIINLVTEVRRAVDQQSQPDFKISDLWLNTFDDIINNVEISRLLGFAASATPANLTAVAPGLATNNAHIAAVIASTGQGRQLRKDADVLTISVNWPFRPMSGGGATMVRGGVEASEVDWKDGLAIKVLHPNQERLLNLQKKWDKDLTKAKAKGDNSIVFAALKNSKDNSPFNLSSIVCLLEFAGKKILLTGDARSDDILNGLRIANLLDENGKIHVDILKVPHHGSSRNSTPEFFASVTADHYVISGDGSHHNPDKATLKMLADAVIGRNDVNFHFTNYIGKFNLQGDMDNFIASVNGQGQNVKVNFLPTGSSSMILDLLGSVTY